MAHDEVFGGEMFIKFFQRFELFTKGGLGSFIVVAVPVDFLPKSRSHNLFFFTGRLGDSELGGKRQHFVHAPPIEDTKLIDKTCHAVRTPL